MTFPKEASASRRGRSPSPWPSGAIRGTRLRHVDPSVDRMAGFFSKEPAEEIRAQRTPQGVRCSVRALGKCGWSVVSEPTLAQRPDESSEAARERAARCQTFRRQTMEALDRRRALERAWHTVTAVTAIAAVLGAGLLAGCPGLFWSSPRALAQHSSLLGCKQTGLEARGPARAGQGSQPRRHWVKGRVLDRATRAPLGGARVAAQPLGYFFGGWAERGETDPDGRFRLAVPGPEMALVFLRAEMPGYALEECGWDVDPRLGETAGEILLRRGGDVEGRVVGPEREPIPDAAVFLSPSGVKHFFPPLEARAGADGRFRFRGCIGDGRTYVVAASASGFVPSSVTFVGSASDLEIVLRLPGRVLEVRVVDDQGDPVSEAEILVDQTRPMEKPADERDSASSALGDFEDSAIEAAYRLASFQTDENGKCTVPLPGSWDAGLYAARRTGDRIWTPRPCSERRTGNRVEITLEAVVELASFVILQPDGAPARHQFVYVSGGNFPCAVDSGFYTSADGRVTLPCRVPDRLFFLARSGFSEALLEQAADREMVVRLQPGRDVWLDVRDATGRAAAGIPVCLMTHLGGLHYISETDSSGRAVFRSVIPCPDSAYSLSTGSRDLLEPDSIELSPEAGGPSLHAATLSEKPWVAVRGVCLLREGGRLRRGLVSLWTEGERRDSFWVSEWDDGRFYFVVNPATFATADDSLSCYVCASTHGLRRSCVRFSRSELASGGRSIVLYAEASGSVTGKAVDSQGRPYRGWIGAGVWTEGTGEVVELESSIMVSPEAIDGRGRFQLAPVPTGIPLCLAIPETEPGEEPPWRATARRIGDPFELKPSEERDVGTLTVPASFR